MMENRKQGTEVCEPSPPETNLLSPGIDARLPVEKSFAFRAALDLIGSGLRFAGSVLVDLCLPRSCAGCQQIDTQPQSSWCLECWKKVPWAISPFCPRCGRPFTDSPDSPDHLCGECIEPTFHFDTARSAVLHEGIIRTRIHQFKFGAQIEWVPSLVELLEIAYAGWGLPEPDVIVPVPLHLKRLKERGFNQSGLLAGELARKLRVPVSFDAIIRKNRTQPQTRLNRRERLKNVKSAFELAGVQRVRGRRILLVDDVFTTGTTLSECARVLKRKGGASEVYAVTVTRALPG